ncbi:hypothetical protein Gotur_026790 [Gossypium turneri]
MAWASILELPCKTISGIWHWQYRKHPM